MAEHLERKGNTEDATQALPPVAGAPGAAETAGEPERRRRRQGPDWRQIKDQGVGLLAAIVRWAGLIFALILVLHIIFVIGEANPDNGIVSWIADMADGLAMGFTDLFTPDDPKLSVLVNFGIAAIFWLVVSAVVSRLIRRVGGAG